MNLLYILLISILGSLVQASTGFGYAVVCMALWPLIMPFKVASAMEVITAFVMVVYLAVKLRKYMNFKLLVFPFIASMLTSIIGVFTLMANTETIMRRIFGLALIILSAYFIFASNRIKIKPTPRNGLIAGAISGFCGGLFNVGGPPMVAYFISVTKDKLEYSATLQLYFVLTCFYTFCIHLFVGNITMEVLRYSAFSMLGMAVGTLMGFYLFKKLSSTMLRKLVYGFMTVFGLYLFIMG